MQLAHLPSSFRYCLNTPHFFPRAIWIWLMEKVYFKSCFHLFCINIYFHSLHWLVFPSLFLTCILLYGRKRNLARIMAWQISKVGLIKHALVRTYVATGNIAIQATRSCWETQGWSPIDISEGALACLFQL